jgi:hypothetical protein
MGFSCLVGQKRNPARFRSEVWSFRGFGVKCYGMRNTKEDSAGEGFVVALAILCFGSFLFIIIADLVKWIRG